MNTTENISSEELEKLRYPIGKYDRSQPLTENSLRQAIDSIAEMPGELRAAVVTLSDEQLDMPYRPGGWSLRQTIHHLADSHMNAYIRMKLALTEENPTIKPYEEARWAELPDAQGDVEISLDLLDALHQRWVLLMDNLTLEQWKRTFNHPESGTTPLDMAAHLYAWHGKHHLTQVVNMRAKMEW
ncbi:YfiT family bacillithiol transferase [Adhaeribacter terreus]|uniref:YfiT family bacillithiol transferase n=1 Tax=Adhaeribacter terreus TaxID=529703 RepID=A0ABW0E7P4_9BACT